MNRRVAVLATAGIAVGSVLFAPASLPAASAATCAFSPTSVAVVVDFGNSSPVSALCVPADSTDSGWDVLGARADILGTPHPTFNQSGLVCSIDGLPTDGCGAQTGSHYAYWSYWDGQAGVWTYSSASPARRVSATRVEGWRFQPDGAANANDPPPRGSADATTTCAPSPTTTAAAPSSPTTAGASPQSTTATSAGAVPAASDATTLVSSTTSSSASSTSQQAAAPGRVTARDKGGGSVMGLVAGAGLVAALGAAGAVVAWRRRSADP